MDAFDKVMLIHALLGTLPLIWLWSLPDPKRFVDRMLQDAIDKAKKPPTN